MSRPSSAGVKRHSRPAAPINYQSMITGPRDPSTHGLGPKLDSSVLSLSGEGIAYKLVSPEDARRYRLVETEEEKRREFAEAKTAANNIRMLSGKPGYPVSPVYPSKQCMAKFIPPNRYTMARPGSAKSSHNKENASSTQPKQSLSPKQARKTSANSSSQKQEVKIVTAPLDPKLVRSIEKMEISFEKNLGVIEKLYQEKLDMKSKIEELEERLGERRKDGDAAADDLEEALKMTKETLAKEETDARDALVGMTATEAAKMFGEIHENIRPKSAISRTSSDLGKSRLRSSEEADIDRYVQKQLHLREKEKEEKLKQKEYEKHLHDRSLRASKAGKPYKASDGTLVYPLVQSMIERNELAMKNSRDKFVSKYEAKEREEKRKREEDKRKKMESLSKPPASLGGPSWRELQDMNEQKRQDRVEKRKSEWATVAVPTVAQPQSTIRATTTVPVEEFVPFTAQNPASVKARLARQQLAFAEKQAQKKAAMEKQKNTKYKFAAGTKEMEKRNEEYAAKKRERIERKKAEEDRKKREEEAKKPKRPSLSKPPVEARRMAKTTIARANLARTANGANNVEKKKEDAKRAAKEKRMKEVSKVVSAQIREFDNERRNKPGYVSLKTPEELEIQNRQAREEFRKKMRENRKKVLDAKNAAPSLISRHNSTIVKEKAHQSALEKLADAIGDTEDDKQGADVLDDDEKLTVRASRDGEYGSYRK